MVFVYYSLPYLDSQTRRVYRPDNPAETRMVPSHMWDAFALGVRHTGATLVRIEEPARRD